MTEKVLVERQGAVARIVLNAPEALNAISPDLAREFSRVVQARPESVEGWNELCAMLVSLEDFPHALAALEVMDENPDVERANRILDWVRRHGHTSFQRSEMHTDLRRAVSRPSEWEGALRLLCDSFWLREVPAERERGKAGRTPTPSYEVSPAVRAEEARP